jgi:hypothetical protein
MTRLANQHRLPTRATRTVVTLVALVALCSCGIADDSVPRDIDPTRLESLNPTP